MADRVRHEAEQLRHARGRAEAPQERRAAQDRQGEIEIARAHGDISENAEFHAAKERQSHIEGRITLLEDRLARAQVIDPSGQSPDVVRFGATVQLADAESGDEVTYTIVGEDEADVSKGLISVALRSPGRCSASRSTNSSRSGSARQPFVRDSLDRVRVAAHFG